ncbi:Flp pilus assembly CpaF family ATPase [Bradyrhizobium sp. GM6.1]
MAIHSFDSEANLRGARMLRTALGPAIAGFLEDPAIVEVMLNPDGRLWIDRLSSGLTDTGESLSGSGWRTNRPTGRALCRSRSSSRLAPDFG